MKFRTTYACRNCLKTEEADQNDFLLSADCTLILDAYEPDPMRERNCCPYTGLADADWRAVGVLAVDDEEAE